MSKNTISSDLKQIRFIAVTFASIFIIFSLFTILILFPLYWLSKNHQNYYLILSGIIFLGLFFFFVIKKSIRQFKVYQSLLWVLLDFVVHRLIFWITLVLFITAEFLCFRIAFKNLPFLFALITVIVCNGVFAAAVIGIRIIYLKLHHFLQSKQIKN